MSGTRADARKAREGAAPARDGWTAALYLDGEQVVTPQPCSDYEAATILAPLVAGWLGGPVSLASAVIAARPPDVEPQGSLFGGEQ